jgi:hypothetical protein
MSFFSWLRIRASLQSPQTRTQRRPAGPRFRPQLEALEDRWLPRTLTVTNSIDSGAGSLRYEIGKAHSGDTIVFAPSLGGQTITLTSGELLINKSLTIAGPGAGQLAVSSGWASRIFEVAPKYALTLSGLTIRDSGSRNDTVNLDGGGIYNHGTLTVSGCTLSGNAALYGGAIFNDSGAALTVSGCTLSGNYVHGSTQYPINVFDDGPDGGAIYNRGTATVANTTLSGNQAYGPDFGMGNAGAIFNEFSGMLKLSDCTLSGNSAGKWGGAIFNYFGTATINGCTFAYNTDVDGGTIENWQGKLTVSNSSFTGNTNNQPSAYIFGGYVDGGGNTFS